MTILGQPSYDFCCPLLESEGPQAVRIVVPPLSHRRAIDRSLADFFRNHRHAAFRRALSDLCRFYDVRLPRIEWFEYIDWGKTAGRTFEDGRIHLIHPENWKRGRIYNSERMWIHTLYHEMGHYLLWSDPERKADIFQRRMVRGLREVRPRKDTPLVEASRRKSSLTARKSRIAKTAGGSGRSGRTALAGDARRKRKA